MGHRWAYMSSEAVVMKYADTKGIQGGFCALCKHEDIISEVAKSCLQSCKDGGLLPFEIPSALALVCAEDGSSAWTPENGLLTSTMKLKRPAIAKAYSAE